MSNFFAGQ